MFLIFINYNLKAFDLVIVDYLFSLDWLLLCVFPIYTVQKLLAQTAASMFGMCFMQVQGWQLSAISGLIRVVAVFVL